MPMLPGIASSEIRTSSSALSSPGCTGSRAWERYGLSSVTVKGSLRRIEVVSLMSWKVPIARR